MKKLLVVMLVLAMAGLANAAMELSIGTTVNEGESLSFDIVAPVEVPQGVYYLGIALDGTTGIASLDDSMMTLVYGGSNAEVGLADSPDDATALGFQNPFFGMSLTDIVDPVDHVVNTIVSGMKLVAAEGGAGDIVLTLYDGDLNFQSSYTVSVVASVIPEPITIGLLGLGGLFLRRRK